MCVRDREREREREREGEICINVPVLNFHNKQ